MKTILVANPKGGVGKSTVATNLAAFLARNGQADGSAWVMLGDLDRQQSAKFWLGLRSAELPTITAWQAEDGALGKPPRGATHGVIDSPAGMHGEALRQALRLADKVLVPLQASMFDIMATHEFLAELASMRAARGLEVGLVGMRVDARTHAAEELHRYVSGLGLPVLGFLRNTQNYVQLAAHGLSLFDVAPTKVEKDLEQWQPITAWALA